MILNERNQRCRNQELVGDWIEQLSEFRNLFPASRESAVEKIRQRRGDKNRDTQNVLRQANALRERGQQYDDQQWHNEDSGKRQCVRKIHDDRSLVLGIMSVKKR